MPRKNDDSAFMWTVLFLAVMAGMVWRQQSAISQRRLMTWTERPVTAAGVMIQAAYPRLAAHSTSLRKVCLHTSMDTFIRCANRLRPWVLWFALLSALLALQPLLARRFGSARHWRFEALIAAAMIAGTGGCGLGLAMPQAWPWPALWLGWAWAAINAAAGLCFLALAIRAYRGGSFRLQHGPAFRPPAVKAGPAITVGRVDPGILPGHARWLAGCGGDIRIPFDRLSCGITILGEKGAGKTRLLFAIHDAIRAQYPNIPILIHDPKCEWFRTYFDPTTDLFFAPHFKGTAAWTLWNDFRRVPELRHELLSTSVYAHQDREDTFWMDQAVDLLHQASGFGTVSQAAGYLGDIPHEHPDDKFLLSVFGTAKLGFLDLAKVEKMSAIAGSPPRCIDDFLRWPSRIILLDNPACASEQRGAFSLFLSAFLLRALSLPDVPVGTLRAVAIIDEALTFSLPPDVDRRIYALCRSKGVCIVAGAQRLPDRQQHERGEWRNAEYTFAMKCVDQDTQRDLSKRAGSLLFERMTKSTTTSPSERAAGPSYTKGEQDVSQEAIPPEHFGRLAPREFALFHDRGIVTGRTVDVAREQRDIALPAYDLREDARQMSIGLMNHAARTAQEAKGGQETWA